MSKALVLSACALALAGCATSYHEKTWWNDGGVSAKQVSADTFLISSSGNDATSQVQVQQHAMRKAADVTLAGGNDWFMVQGQQGGKTSSGGMFIPTGGGMGLFAGLSEPESSLTIRVGKNPRPDGAMDAREVIAFASK